MDDAPTPNPFTPPDCDLTGFAFMPIDVQRLLASDTWVLASGEERSAAFCLWLSSWHQVPAASLPNDERILAHKSMSKAWRKVKAHALRGWVLCSDGRLYHPVVAEKALESWLGRLTQRLVSGAGNEKRWGTEFDETTVKAQIGVASDMLRKLDPNSPALVKTARRQQRKQSKPDAGGSPSGNPQGTPNGTPAAIPTGSQVDSREGTGERGEGTGERGQLVGNGEDQELLLAAAIAASSSPSAGKPAPATPQGTPAARLEARVAQLTEDAIAAYNEILGRPNGQLTSVHKTLGRDERRKQVKRVATLAGQAAEAATGAKVVTLDFWRGYFGECDRDAWLRGDGPYKPPHENFRPDFEYLTRKEVMLKVVERARNEAEAEAANDDGTVQAGAA